MNFTKKIKQTSTPYLLSTLYLPNNVQQDVVLQL